MNNNLQDEIAHYRQYIGKAVICLNKNYPILIVKEVIKHPFKNKAAYKFEGIKEIIICDQCVESLLSENEQLKELKQYVGHTIYFKDENNGINLPGYVNSNNNIESFYKVTAVEFNEKIKKNYFVLHNGEIREAKNFHLFKHSECFYTDFKYYNKIPASKWVEMFNIFQNIDESLLCFNISDIDDEYKVKGFVLTNYNNGENNEWHLVSMMYDTRMNAYTYNLNTMASNLAQARDQHYKIEKRNLYFFLNGRIFEFYDKEDKDSLKTVSSEIKWILKNHTLHEKLTQALPNKVQKTKKNKI